MTEGPTCDVCGGPATPGGLPGESEIETICPECEDWHRVADSIPARPRDPARLPPHDNTTR